MCDLDQHRLAIWRTSRKIDDLLADGCSQRGADFVWSLIRHPRFARLYFSSSIGKGTAPLLVICRGRLKKSEVRRMLEAMRPYYKEEDYRYIEGPLEWLSRPFWWPFAHRLGLVRAKPGPEREREARAALKKLLDMFGLEVEGDAVVSRLPSVK